MSEHPIFRHYLMSYHEALKGLKASVFDDKFHAVPKKGSAAYNMIQDVRQGKDIEFPTTIKQLIKPEEPRAKPKAGKKLNPPVVPKNGLNKIVVENIEPRMSAPKPTTAPVAATPAPVAAPEPTPAPVAVEKPKKVLVNNGHLWYDIYDNMDWKPNVNLQAIYDAVDKITKHRGRTIRYTERQQFTGGDDTTHEKMITDFHTRNGELEVEKNKKEKLYWATNSLLPGYDKIKREYEIAYEEYQDNKNKLNRYINWRPKKRYGFSFTYDSYNTEELVKKLGNTLEERQLKDILTSRIELNKEINKGRANPIRTMTMGYILTDKDNYVFTSWDIHRMNKDDYITRTYSNFEDEYKLTPTGVEKFKSLDTIAHEEKIKKEKEDKEKLKKEVENKLKSKETKIQEKKDSRHYFTVNGYKASSSSDSKAAIKNAKYEDLILVDVYGHLLNDETRVKIDGLTLEELTTLAKPRSSHIGLKFICRWTNEAEGKAETVGYIDNYDSDFHRNDVAIPYKKASVQLKKGINKKYRYDDIKVSEIDMSPIKI